MLSSEKVQKIRKMVADDADLWDVLTALRGPDDESDRAKRATTGVIRHALLGAQAGRHHYCSQHDGERNLHGSLFGPDCEDYAKIREEMGSSHFYHHAYKAFLALGLSWGKVNK